ncbi:unnamed protein product [Orchesella dallaii]|uniref:Uncharacterized protein n=1 Tax=Orchesella dallaii TaxID=48710 RepID=A0ABP1S6C6_9HEXA
MSVIIESIRKILGSPCETVTNHGENEAKICICEAISPVLRYCQFFGIFPASLHSPYDDDDDGGGTGEKSDLGAKLFNKGVLANATNVSTASSTLQKSKCYIKARWFSYPSFVNSLLLVSFFVVTTWVLLNIQNVLKVYFLGTDFYTFGTQTICLYSQNIIILGSSFIHRKKFGEIWTLLLKTLRKLGENPVHHNKSFHGGAASGNNYYSVKKLVIETILQNTADQIRHQNISGIAEELDKENEEPVAIEVDIKKGSKIWHRLKLLRIFSIVAISTAFILSLVHTTLVTTLLFNACFDAANETDPTIGNFASGKPPCPFGNFFLFMQKLFYGVIDFVHQGVAVLFGVMCLVVYIFFREIEEQMEATLKSGRGHGHGGDTNMSNTKLNSVGIQSHFTIECLRMCYEDLSQCCRLMSQCFGLGILAVMITSVISITCSLYSYTLYTGAIQNDETVNVAKFYVIWAFHGWFGAFCLAFILLPGQMITSVLSQFQHQSRHPVVLTACDVTNVGLSFIAAAATNVTTYILVILQFRLGVERD